MTWPLHGHYPHCWQWSKWIQIPFQKRANLNLQADLTVSCWLSPLNPSTESPLRVAFPDNWNLTWPRWAGYVEFGSKRLGPMSLDGFHEVVHILRSYHHFQKKNTHISLGMVKSWDLWLIFSTSRWSRFRSKFDAERKLGNKIVQEWVWNQVRLFFLHHRNVHQLHHLKGFPVPLRGAALRS